MQKLTIRHKTIKPFTLDKDYVVCHDDCDFAWNYGDYGDYHTGNGCCLKRISDNASLSEYDSKFKETCPNDGEVMVLLDAEDISELQMLVDDLYYWLDEFDGHDEECVPLIKRIAEILDLEVNDD